MRFHVINSYLRSLTGIFFFGMLFLCHTTIAQSPRDIYQKAVAHMEQSEWQPAIELLKKVIETVPGNARLHNTLGIAFSSAGQSKAAVRQFQRALDLEPKYRSALKNLALHEMSRKRPDLAEEYFERLLELVPEDSIAHLGLAEVAFARGNFSVAVLHFENGKSLLMKEPRLVINFAKSYVETKQQLKAAQLLETLPTTVGADIHFEAGLILTSLNRYSSAALAFEQAEGERVDPYDRGFNLALAYLRNEQYENAVATGKKLIAKGHRKAELYNLLSRAYEHKGDTQQAYDALRTATEINPSDATHYIDLIALCLDHKNFDLGLEIADISVKRNPESHSLRLQLGVTLAMKGRFQDAERAFEQAAELSPNGTLAGVALGLILLQQDRVPDAIRVLRKWRYRAESDYMVHWFLAEALNRSGVATGSDGETEAIDALQQSVELNPELFQSRVLLGKMLSRRGALQEAIAQFNKARKIDPSDVSATYHLAQAYRKKGDMEQAKTLFDIVGKQKTEDREQFTKSGLLRIVREGSP